MFGRGTRRRHVIDVKVTYLQSFEPAPPPPAPPTEGVQVLRAHAPTVAYYRFLYVHVGSPWMWYERRRLEDAALEAIIHDERVAVEVLYVRGVPAGFVELDRRRGGETEIAYFGLMPEFIGHGLGRFFIRWAVHRAWQGEVRRVWLHTCSMDHPRALGVYRGAGLEPYAEETVRITDPREFYPDLGREPGT